MPYVLLSCSFVTLLYCYCVLNEINGDGDGDLSEKSSDDFHKILYTAADFELDERHVIRNEKVALDRLRVRQNVFLV